MIITTTTIDHGKSCSVRAFGAWVWVYNLFLSSFFSVIIRNSFLLLPKNIWICPMSAGSLFLSKRPKDKIMFRWRLSDVLLQNKN